MSCGSSTLKSSIVRKGGDGGEYSGLEGIKIDSKSEPGGPLSSTLKSSIVRKGRLWPYISISLSGSIEEFEDKEKDLSGLIGLPLVKLQKILDS